MQTTLRKMGNSSGLILPKAMLDKLGLACGAKFDVALENGKFVVTPVKRKVREGWAEAAAEIVANESDEERREREEWLAMSYDELDDEWVWDGKW